MCCRTHKPALNDAETVFIGQLFITAFSTLNWILIEIAICFGFSFPHLDFQLDARKKKENFPPTADYREASIRFVFILFENTRNLIVLPQNYHYRFDDTRKINPVTNTCIRGGQFSSHRTKYTNCSSYQ